MAPTPSPERPRPPTLEEKLGRWWGLVFVATVVILTVAIAGKSCLFEG